MYSNKGITDKGTLFQIKQLINHAAVGSSPDKNMKSTEDFLLVALHAYIVVAARFCIQDKDFDTCSTLAKEIVANYVKISLPSDEAISTSMDAHYNYTTDFLSLALLWHAFHDSTKEGDGNRILQYWKFFIALFQQEKHFNYAKEALTITIQSQILSPRRVAELKWSRTINVSGRVGCNIPTDLHMEHLNCRLKIMINNLGSNVKPTVIQQSAKSLGIVNHVCTKFEAEAEVSASKSFHTCPSFAKHFTVILNQLESEEVFKIKDGRKLHSYDCDPILQSLNWKKVTEYIHNKIIEFNFN